MKQQELYELYQKGRQFESESKWQEAIETYIAYSKALDPKDQYIPYYWIAQFYRNLGEDEASIQAKIKYASGCSPASSAKLLTEIGNELETLGRLSEAIELYKEASIRHEKTDLSAKIAKLSNQLS